MCACLFVCLVCVVDLGVAAVRGNAVIGSLWGWQCCYCPVALFSFGAVVVGGNRGDGNGVALAAGVDIAERESTV